MSQKISFNEEDTASLFFLMFTTKELNVKKCFCDKQSKARITLVIGAKMIHSFDNQRKKKRGEYTTIFLTFSMPAL